MNPSEREITAPVDECLANGRLNPEAIGWSRFPLHRCNVRGPWSRVKRWDYWCVTAEPYVFSVVFANIDYLAFAAVWFRDLESGLEVERAAGLPFGVGFKQEDTVSGADIRVDRFGLRLGIEESAAGTRLVSDFSAKGGARVRADLFVTLPPDHESLNVLIPWSDRRFQFTSKHNTRPAVGSVVIGEKRHEFGPDRGAYGVLDFGRGVWPLNVIWNWGSASGVSNGRVVGLQLGGKWTDGTGLTENGIILDGRLHKISEDLAWEYDTQDFTRPWRIRAPQSKRVDLTFVPTYERAERFGGRRQWPIGADVHQCFGHYSGTVVDDAGAAVEVDRLFGWAEQFKGRW